MLVMHFRELEVYKLAYATAMRVFQLSKRFPVEERYSLTDQMRRSSRSVCSNIAEGWRKRRYEAAFVSKLSDADTEATETQVWLDFARDCGYLPEETAAELNHCYDQICGMLTNMMRDSARWCAGSQKGSR